MQESRSSEADDAHLEESLRRRWVYGYPLPMRFGLLPHDNTHTAAAACVAVRPSNQSVINFLGYYRRVR